MTTQTPKRIAADIIRTDMEIVTGYWQERLAGMGIKLDDAAAAEIQNQMDKILTPFLDRMDTIAKDTNVLNLGD